MLEKAVREESLATLVRLSARRSENQGVKTFGNPELLGRAAMYLY